MKFITMTKIALVVLLPLTSAIAKADSCPAGKSGSPSFITGSGTGYAWNDVEAACLDASSYALADILPDQEIAEDNCAAQNGVFINNGIEYSPVPTEEDMCTCYAYPFGQYTSYRCEQQQYLHYICCI